jgi:hypothetical protein
VRKPNITMEPNPSQGLSHEENHRQHKGFDCRGKSSKIIDPHFF